MEFNALVKTQLFPILQKNGLELVEDLKNILKFQSSVVRMNIAFNEYDRTVLVECGKVDDILYPFNNFMIRSLFNSSLPIEGVTPEISLRNLSTLFETTKGAAILRGDIKLLKSIAVLQSENYTSDLLLQQTLVVASESWEINDYQAFVKCIDKIGINKMPKSYQLKYKIAKQKLLEKRNTS